MYGFLYDMSCPKYIYIHLAESANVHRPMRRQLCKHNITNKVISRNLGNKVHLTLLCRKALLRLEEGDVQQVREMLRTVRD